MSGKLSIKMVRVNILILTALKVKMTKDSVWSLDDMQV